MTAGSGNQLLGGTGADTITRILVLVSLLRVLAALSLISEQAQVPSTSISPQP